MKKLILGLFVIITSLFLLFSIMFINSFDKVYNLSDFNEIVIDESTLNDVLIIAPQTIFYTTGKGGFCSIPLNDGNTLYIKFYGPEMLVSEMEIRDGNEGTVLGLNLNSLI